LGSCPSRINPKRQQIIFLPGRQNPSAMIKTLPRSQAPDISIRNRLCPGDIGCITYLHAMSYADQGWDHTFDAYVAAPLAEFARTQSERERIWIVERKGKIVGSEAVVKFTDDQAQLRWLLLDRSVRGLGIGRMLVGEALDFCRRAGYHSVFLWTVRQLTIAARLYQSAGFKKTEELTHELWGSTVTEVKYELEL